MTTLLKIAGQLGTNLNNIVPELTAVYTSAGAAALQYDLLTKSNDSAVPGNQVGGIDVLSSSKDGRVSAGVFSDKLDTFGSLTSLTNGANMFRVVTSTTTEGTNAAFNSTFGSLGILPKRQLFEASLFASESLADSSQLPLGASTVGLLSTSYDDIVVLQNKLLAGVNYSKSILEDMTGESDLTRSIETPELLEQAGVPSIPIIGMDNVAPRTYLQTYEEIEAYLRSSRREFTEVVVHATDTTRDMLVNYDVLRYWDSARDASDVGYHLIIQPDGSLEVCRPIYKDGAHTLKGHNKYSVGIAFVGGVLGNRNDQKLIRSRQSYTGAQWKTFDKFMEAFYSVVPGGQAWGHNSIDPTRRGDPHFDVPKYVKRRFDKTNTQTAQETRQRGPLTIDELIEAQY